ncbi:amino acid ABC transporter substrate-binding protein [Pseudaminobacter arsenicus]|uniref:Amino acid ABC transporter substrate-binding protein n=1 Tax=Borborobacter arsenicus TaxID=1851146 RepID=A0A432V7W4_9HYPH|nr:ABC transporter substrate-binding protein [Pseudaminobacter arsenicus]RUM98256.1 amino acid ABC transporter substrate-binding protein [Pseudaminobacter arsenicus]
MQSSKLFRQALAIGIATSLGFANAAIAAPDAGEYQLGIISDDTGPIASAGISYHDGADLAIKEINEKGLAGEGVTFTLSVKDSASDAARSVQATTQFAADRNILAIICCVLSPNAAGVSQFAIQSGLPVVIYGATREGLPQEPYITSVVALPGPQEVLLAERMAAEFAPKKVAYIKQSDSDIQSARATKVQKVMEAVGVETSAEVFVLGADTDFSGPATQAMVTKPEMIFVWANQTAGIGVITALRQRGYDGQIVTSDIISPPAVFEKSGATVANIPFAVSFQPGVSDSSTAQAFIDAYKADYGKLPDVYAAQGYTAIHLIAQGMKSLDGKPTRKALAEAIWNITEIEHNVYGGQQMENGQARTPGTLIVNWTKEGEVKRWEK